MRKRRSRESKMSFPEMLDAAYASVQEVRYWLDRASDSAEAEERRVQEAKAEGWWEGVNDQWKHLPQGNRLLESANPYRSES